MNEKFETAGFESTYFMNNLGTMTLIISGKIVLIAIWLVLALISMASSWAKNKRKRLSKYIFWNSWITTVYDSFVIVLLCSAISFKYNFSMNSTGQIV